MITYIIFLRGINVGGHKKIKMQDLQQLFQSLGCSQVVTYIQSGNVVCKSKECDRQRLRLVIEGAISDRYGFEVKVFVKTHLELSNQLEQCPYQKEDLQKIYFTFLSAMPTDLQKNLLLNLQYPPERYQLVDDVLVVYCENGYGKTKLTNTLFESKLKLTATTRNWNTLQALLQLSTNLS